MINHFKPRILQCPRLTRIIRQTEFLEHFGTDHGIGSGPSAGLNEVRLNFFAQVDDFQAFLQEGFHRIMYPGRIVHCGHNTRFCSHEEAQTLPGTDLPIIINNLVCPHNSPIAQPLFICMNTCAINGYRHRPISVKDIKIFFCLD